MLFCVTIKRRYIICVNAKVQQAVRKENALDARAQSAEERKYIQKIKSLRCK